jgi:ASC-1-like (ASCH) protein
MRLNDEKRSLIKVGDFIKFINRVTNEEITTLVKGLYYYESFDELYRHFDKVSIGYDEDEDVDPNDMSQYYSNEDIEKYGVVGIEIKVTK